MRIPLLHRGDRNIYEPGSTVLIGELKGCSTNYGDGLEVRFDRAYLDQIVCGDSTQKDHLILGTSSIRGRTGISQSQLMEGILALQPREADCKSAYPIWIRT